MKELRTLSAALPLLFSHHRCSEPAIIKLYYLNYYYHWKLIS